MASSAAIRAIAPAAWRLRIWDDPDIELIVRAANIIVMSADEVGSLMEWPGESALRDRLHSAMPDRKSAAISMFVTYWRYFRIEMRPGDVVVVPFTEHRAGIALVEGAYEYHDEEVDPRLRHRRAVSWLRTVERGSLDGDTRRVVNAPGTICRLSAVGAGRRLLKSNETPDAV